MACSFFRTELRISNKDYSCNQIYKSTACYVIKGTQSVYVTWSAKRGLRTNTGCNCNEIAVANQELWIIKLGYLERL